MKFRLTILIICLFTIVMDRSAMAKRKKYLIESEYDEIEKENNDMVLEATGSNNLEQSQDQAKGSNGFLRIDHITWWVGNAKQAAQYYCLRMGFKPLAYQGLNAGSSEVASHVVSHGDIVFVFKSVYNSDSEKNLYMGNHLVKHGDGVRDVAFEVVDLDAIVETLLAKGVKLMKDIWEESDEGGAVRFARVQPFGDTVHTFVERKGYKGLFLPGYKPPLEKDNLLQNLPSIQLGIIDHVVEAVPDQGGEDLVNWYMQNLMFKPFTSPDSFVQHANYSSRKTRVVANSEDTPTIRLPIIETTKGWVQSAIEKFVNSYDGAGVEHIAFTTDNLVECVQNMRDRGQQFLDIPDAYYDNIKISLKNSPVEVTESIDLLQKLRILIDYDDHGYLLQIFTKHLQDRTSIFLEVIQRKNHQGLGAGNFKRLFDAIQMEGQTQNVSCIEGVICNIPTSPSYEAYSVVGS